MRISFNSFPDGLVDQLGGLMSQQSKLQTQVSSGQRIKLAEDDPNAMSTVLDAQAEAQATNQYQTNVARQQQLATSNYSAIKSLKTLSDRASEIATLAGGVKSTADTAAYAKEINEMIKQAVQFANGKDRDSYLFGGTSGAQPFALTTDDQGTVTNVTYQGNTSVNQSEIAEGSTFSAQVIGSNTTGAGPRGLITDSSSGADFFNHLVSLRDNLTAGNRDLIANTDTLQLQHDGDNFIYHIGLNGATQSRLETSASVLKDRTLSLNSQVSSAAGTDIAQTVVRLTQAQTAYQAAIQSSGKILSMSLMDYLK